MGRAKELWLEQEEYSARTGMVADLERGSKFVGSRMLLDHYAANYVESNGIDGICSYSGEHCKVMDIVNLAEWVAGRILRYFRNPSEDNLYLESSFKDKDEDVDEDSGIMYVEGFATLKGALYYESTEELLDNYKLTDNDSLLSDIASCLRNTSWINIDSYAMREDDELSFYWSAFAKQIKEIGGYVPSAFSVMHISGERNFNEVLDDIASILVANKRIKKLPSRTSIFRCRNINKRDEIRDYFQDMTAAPPEYAFANRMSKAGDSVFYGAFEGDVSRMEAVSKEKPLQALAEFKTKRELTVVDLTNLPNPSIWADANYYAMSFLHIFTQRVSENYDDYSAVEKEQEYIPSQVFTLHIRQMQNPEDGCQIDGIIYYSSKLPGKENIVLFCDNNTSSQYVDLVHVAFKERERFHDFTAIRKATIEMASFNNVGRDCFDTTDSLYFDETGNIKLFRLSEERFNNPEDTHFVLGGIEAKNDTTTAELLSLFHRQSNAPEIKSKAVFNGDFTCILKNRYLADFLQYCIDKEWHIHFTAINALYYSVVDIVDSMDIKELSYINEAKTYLYNVLKSDFHDTVEMMNIYNYPDLQESDVEPFCKHLIERINLYQKDCSHSRFSPLAKMLLDALTIVRKTTKMVFIQDETKGELIKGFGYFYLEKIHTFPFSQITFDNEQDVADYLDCNKVIVYGKKVENYKMIDSKSEPLIQVSDIVVGILSRYFKFVDTDYKNLLAKLKLFDATQLNNLKLLNKLLNNSCDYNPAFFHYVVSVEQIMNFQYMIEIYK
jgi:hypothetical protein